MATKMDKEWTRKKPPHYNFKLPKEHIQVDTHTHTNVEEKMFNERYLSLENTNANHNYGLQKPPRWF